MIKSYEGIRVSGMSLVVPVREINIYDEAQYYGGSTKKVDRIRKMAGFWKRRVVDEDVTATDLGVQAAENLIAGTGVDRATIQALVFVVQQPDYGGPVTSYSMHHRLGLSEDCFVTDIVQGCAGWCLGLYTAFQMVASGTVRRVLLVATDTPAKGLRPDDRVNAPLFGDAGCATMVEADESAGRTVFNIETVSAGFEAIIGPSAGRRMNFDIRKPEDVEVLTREIPTKRGGISRLCENYMDGGAVFEFTMSRVPKNLNALMAANGTAPGDYDLLCLHQANKQIVQTVGAGAGFNPEKVPYAAFETFGNNTMCSIPSTILLAMRESIRSGTARLLCSGFGNGLVVCSVDLSLGRLSSADIKAYVMPTDHKTNAQWIDYWQNKIANT